MFLDFLFKCISRNVSDCFVDYIWDVEGKKCICKYI